MNLAFDAAQFREVFVRYNEAMWPAALVLPLVAIACAAMIISRRRPARRVALLMLGALWGWTALAYHLAFFTQINRAAVWFALLSLTQAAMFVYASFGELRTPSMRVDGGRLVGGIIIAFALVIYPALSYIAGHRYPAMPTFGAPCPTAIFTIGVLAALHEELHWRYAIIPLVWAAIATFAALQLGMVEDLGLTAAAGALIALMSADGFRASRAIPVQARQGR